nr:NAD(P)H-hydrate epimerase [Pandoraea sp. PE-S2T-3]
MTDHLRVDDSAAAPASPSPLARPSRLPQPSDIVDGPLADTPLPLYLPADLREIERASAAQLPPHTLMARAGAVVADWLYGQLPSLATAGRQPVLLLAGPGNNGGDAYVAAREMHRRGVLVDVWQLAPPAADDAKWAHGEALAAGVPVRPAPDVWPQPSTYAWIVDGLFGIGLSRPLNGPAGRLVENIAYAHAQGTPVLAIRYPQRPWCCDRRRQWPCHPCKRHHRHAGRLPGAFDRRRTRHRRPRAGGHLGCR